MKSLTKIISFLVAGLAICLALVLFVLNPILKNVVASKEALSAKKTELSTLDQQIRAFKTAQSDLAKATRKDDINNAISVKESSVAAVKDLEAASDKTGSGEILQIIEPTATSAPPARVIPGANGFDEVPYELSTINTFVGTINFLSYLEHLPHFTEISKITLSSESLEGSAETSASTGRVIGNFKGVFFINSPKSQ